MPNEYSELVPESPELQENPEFIQERVVNVLYKNLRLNKSVTTTLEERCFFGTRCKKVLVIRPVSTSTPLGNDTLVTIPSASGQGSFGSHTTNSITLTGGAGRNHSSIANGEVALTVFPWLIQVDRTKGGLK